MRKNTFYLLRIPIVVFIVMVFLFSAVYSQPINVKDYIKEKFPSIFSFYLSSLEDLDSYEKEFIDLLEKLPEEKQEYYAKEVYENGFSLELLEKLKKGKTFEESTLDWNKEKEEKTVVKTKEKPKEEVPEEGAAPAPTLWVRAKIGEEASNEQVEVTVHSVKFYDQITGGLGGTYKLKQEGNAFVIVDMSIRNVGGLVLEVSPVYLRLFDNQGNRCSRTMLIIAGVPYELKKLRGEELSQDEERRGMVIFTAKEGTILDKVSYTTPKPAIDVSLEDLKVSVPLYRMPGIGEVARGGGIEMRVSSVGSVEKLEKEYGDKEFKLIWTETAKKGQELVVVDLSIKNVFIEPDITINPLYVLLIDTESKVYGKAVLTIALEGELGLTDLSPGEETTGRLLFSVPAGVTLDRVMYKIGALGPPVQVNLRE